MQTVDRAFTVLRAIAAQPSTSTLADVARAAELPKATVHRLLGALEEQSMVQQIGGRWALGPGLLTLTHEAAPVSALRELARPHLVELAQRLEEHASLAVPDGDATLYIDTAVSESSVTVQDWTGERLPYHASAAGLALMSSWTEDEVTRYTDAGLEAFTDSTVTTLKGLRHKITCVANDGAVWTRQEFSDDVNGIGAPILDRRGVAVGAINIYGPDYRFPGDRKEAEIVAPLLAACTRISSLLD